MRTTKNQTDTATNRQAAQVVVRPWHALPAETVLSMLSSSPDGLSDEEARTRLLRDGPNQLIEKRGRPVWLLFLDQFKSPLIAILAGAAVVAYFFGKGFDVYVILAVVILNAVIGFALEYHASGAIAALRRMTSPQARVLRDGAVTEVPIAEVVVGDVLALEAGDRVAADARLLAASELTADESGLTGESVPASKSPEPIEGGLEVPLGDRENLVYMHSAVTTGRGRAVVVGTGMATEIGRIAEAVAEADAEPPIQKRLARFGTGLGLAIIGIVLVVMGIGMALGRPVGEMIYVAISLAVAAIPEGLPLVVSALFAIGVTRMARRRALIRRLPAVEALGAATVIGTDKTGTLTRNQMTVRRVWLGGQVFEVTGDGYAPEGKLVPPPNSSEIGLRWLAACARLANDAALEREGGRWRAVGDPTEGALLPFARKVGFHEDWPRVQEIPFSSERKWMATLHRTPNGELVAFAKGAVERLLPMAHSWIDLHGEIRPLEAADREAITQAASAMAEDALRVLALGMVREVDHPGAMSGDLLRDQLTFLGLVGMIDPPRPEAIAANAKCQQAGIRVVMITGDHRETGTAIARQMGILTDGEVVEGARLEALSEAELDAHVGRVSVYARVNPAHKLRIVRALQRQGELVAMTGDGVNDAPALSQADIGIAMGITGTEVAKGAAGMVLADDNFATIVAAVEEGRAIGDNLRKVVGYLMATCVGNIATIAAAIVTGLPLPLTAVMLLWINLVAIGAFDKTLALEQGEPDVMDRPPRAPNASLMPVDALIRVMVIGLFMAVGTVASFTWELDHGAALVHAQTQAFTVMAAFQWFSAFAYRSESRSLFALPMNPWMIGSVVLALALQLLAVYWWPFQAFLGTEAIRPAEFASAIAIGASLLVASEVIKAVRRVLAGPEDR